MTTKFPLLSRWALSLITVFALTACTAEDADVPAAPVVQFPAWSTAYNQSQTVQVTPAPGWPIDRVEYSTDGINWMQAKPGTGDGYAIALTNLDIGTTELTLRVTSSYRGQSEVNYYYSEIQNVAAVFDCTTPATSMLPSSTMILQDGNEVRTLVGYFGDSQRGHSVVAYIDYTDEPAGGGAGSTYQIEGVMVTFQMASQFALTQP